MIINKSSNKWTKNRPNNTIVPKSSNGTSGDNLTSSPFGFDDLYSGTAYGIGEYGGIKHFEGST